MGQLAGEVDGTSRCLSPGDPLPRPDLPGKRGLRRMIEADRSMRPAQDDGGRKSPRRVGTRGECPHQLRKRLRLYRAQLPQAVMILCLDAVPGCAFENTLHPPVALL